MPKSKRGPSLFDMLGEERADTPDVLKVPTWWERRQRAVDAHRVNKAARGKASEESEPKAAPPYAERQGSALEEPVQAEVGDSPPGAGPRPVRLVELDGACIRLSLTAKTAAIVVFAGVVLLVAAFELGHRSGETRGRGIGFTEGQASYAASAISEIEAARNAPPATHLVKDLLVDRSESAAEPEFASVGQAEPSSQTSWVRGNTYIVAQEFTAGWHEDAIVAQEFLSEHGVATELVELSSGALQLLTTQGYNRQAPTQRKMADELLTKVHAIGEKYYASGGGYKLEGYFKTLKNDTW